MPETLTKLRPDRDLECYFEQPSAIAALSNSSADGFTVSGNWRQQFDWAVLEWNRDNVTEHPALRNLPDGDLSGVVLTYDEVRTNCVPMDSKTYDSVGWSYLRIWEESGGSEHFHWVPLRNYATAIEGSYTQATCHFDLGGTATAGDLIELAWLDQHANAAVGSSLATALADLAGFINAKPDPIVTAVASGTGITLTYTGAVGANGNRVGVYGGVYGAKTESWSPASAMFTGGVSPTKWRVALDFSNLTDLDLQPVTTTNIRKLRWTWAPELVWANFPRGEFQVAVTNWQSTGTGLSYHVAGPGSRRIEDDSSEVSYSGSWTEERGNYSGGSIRYTGGSANYVECAYSFPAAHSLYLGTRFLDAETSESIQATVVIDGGAGVTIDLKRPKEDQLVRIPLGQLSANATHTVRVTHTGTSGKRLYFDFFEIALPAADLPEFPESPAVTLATDWDTNHSLAIPPERTAWLIHKLGFTGRANHYVGALWFYDLLCAGNQYSSATVEFAGTPHFGDTTTLTLAGTPIVHQNYISDTATSIAKCFEQLITAGASAVWAQASGTTLTITARALGTLGDALTLAASTDGDVSGNFTATASGTHLTGGVDGRWLTDLDAIPRMNRAARDWSRAYFGAMDAYGIEVTAAFSMELGNGDDSLTAGIAQRYPDGPVLLNTPALQTNFSPASLAYWKQTYLNLAELMTDAGITPYLQFGETQWWYFADASGMPFYDDYTKSAFEAAHSRPLPVIASQNADPASYLEETAFLVSLVGQFTDAVMEFVRATYPSTKFEVLYPPDTNSPPFNRAVNFPDASWTASSLDCLKTENFTFTGDRNLNLARTSITFPAGAGFPPSKSSHLVGIGDYTTPWLREHLLALGAGLESVVLFALDQFCLIGYRLPLSRGPRRSVFMGR